MEIWPAKYVNIPLWLPLIIAGSGAFWIHRSTLARIGDLGLCMAALTLVCLAALAISARAPIKWNRPGGVVQLGAGGLLVRWGQPLPSPGSMPTQLVGRMVTIVTPRPVTDADLFWWFSHSTTGAEHVLRIPLWPLLLLSSAAVPWLSHRSRMRTRPGHCTRCGYNLSGLPTPTDPSIAPRCPECGNNLTSSESVSPPGPPSNTQAPSH
jgi:hypothetical protein